ncbi:MAG: autotransporter domain-containing protein [Pseudomonadota bacterium]
MAHPSSITKAVRLLALASTALGGLVMGGISAAQAQLIDPPDPVNPPGCTVNVAGTVATCQGPLAIYPGGLQALGPFPVTNPAGTLTTLQVLNLPAPIGGNGVDFTTFDSNLSLNIDVSPNGINSAGDGVLALVESPFTGLTTGNGSITIDTSGNIQAVLNGIVGTVRDTALPGARATNYSVTIRSQSDITSAIRGIFAITPPSGTIDITSNGVITVNAASAQGFFNPAGIEAENVGSGVVRISANGDILVTNVGAPSFSPPGFPPGPITGSIDGIRAPAALGDPNIPNDILITASAGTTITAQAPTSANGIFATAERGTVVVDSSSNITATSPGASAGINAFTTIFGPVSVTSNGTITATDFGISASSNAVNTGGFGGVTIDANGAITVNDTDGDSQAIGISGRAQLSGDVIIRASQTVTVSGNNAIGLLASANGTGNAEFTVSNTVNATAGATGIVVGVQPGSTGTVNVNGTSVFGGTVSAIDFLGPAGSTNVLNTSGTTSLSATSGVAAQGGAGNTTINNTGVLSTLTNGAIRLDIGGGTNAFNNQAGSTFNSGAIVNLGAGNLFTNAGTLSLGGVGANSLTTITGNFAQTAFGTFLVDVDAGGTNDLLAVNGAVDLTGSTLALTLTGDFSAPPIQDNRIIIQNDGTDAVTGTFGNGLGLNGAGTIFTAVNTAAGDGNDVELQLFQTSITLPNGATNAEVVTFPDGFPAFTFFVNGTDAATFSGALSQAGSPVAINFNGTGTLDVTSINPVTGPLTVNGGLLNFTGTGSIGSTTVAVNTGELQTDGGAFTGLPHVTVAAGTLFDVNGNETLASLENSGTTDVDPTATLTVATVTNNTGGQIVNAGTVNATTATNNGGVTNSGTFGATTLINNAQFINSGLLTLINPFDNNAGGTLITSGVVNGGVVNDGAINASGTFNGPITNQVTGLFTVTADLVGNGAFTNAATLDVSGGSFTGLTALTNTGAVTVDPNRTLAAATVNQTAGTMTVNGFLTGDTTIGGGLLQGVGQINGNLTVGAGGIVSPGNPGPSIGTLNVAGNFTQTTTGNLLVDIDAAGNSDLLAITGTANLNGALAIVGLSPQAAFPNQQSYTILTAAGGRTGQFSTVTDNLPDLDLSATYLPNSVVIGYTRTAAAAALSDKSIFANSVTGSVLASRLFAEAMRERQGVRQLGDGAGLGQDGASLAFGAATDAGSAMHNPWMSSFSDTGGSVPGLGEPTTSFEVWLGGLGAFGEVDSTRVAPGFDSAVVGFAGGLDVVNNGAFGTLRFGVAGGYTVSDIDSLRSGADVETIHAGVSGSLASGPFLLNAAGALGFQTYDLDRLVPLIGAPAVLARSSADGTLIEVALDSSYDLAAANGWGTAHNLRVAPIVSFDHVAIARDGFVETGAGILNLTVDSSDFSRSWLGAGVEFAATFEGENGFSVTPSLAVKYEHGIGSDTLSVNSQIPTVAGATFRDSGAALNDHALAINAGLDVAVSDRFSLTTTYAGSFGDNAWSHRGGISASLAF